MAAVLDALAPYVKKLIADMAQEEVSMLLGVSGEITKLEDNMESLKAFLADAERRRISEQSVLRWVRKLKDAMYDATDIIDLCQLEAYKRKESKGGSSEEKVPGCFKPLLFCLQNPMFAHKIGSRIKELNQRLDEIYKGAAKFNFITTNLSSYQDCRMLPDAEQNSSLKTMAEFDETAIVGENIERDTKELAQVLIANDNPDLRVVSIVGTGGMGKTTLAQKIFKEAAIQEHFKVKIWLSINKHFDEIEVVRTAIEHAGGVHGGTRDKMLLTRTLTNILSASMFLVVMDDVWSEAVWKDVLSVPIRNASQKQPGCRVLVTTRLQDLAPKLGESFHQHNASPLDKEDAWSLLKKQLLPNQVDGIEQLKNIGMEILKRCDGLPLAIKVMGGLLSTRYPSESEWKAVLNDRAWSVAGLPQELDSRLYLSYEDLSPQLKQCFLYCSLFPKGQRILQNVVTRMWMSEGLIQAPDESSSHEHGLEEIAIDYHRELIKRNLIEPTEGYSLNGYSCTMHDVVSSFAEYMAREESLVVQVDDNKKPAAAPYGGSMLVRRLSVGRQNVSSVVEWAVLRRKKSLLRTLIIDSSIRSFQPVDLLSCSSSLRVLNIESADSDGIAAALSKLRHLRYLRLKDTNISSLPEDIHKMKFLQHIVLVNCEKLVHLPGSITKLVHLRTLVLNGSNINVVPKGLGGLSNLRLLYGFPVHMDMDADAGSSSWCSLQELAPLSQLRDLTLSGLEKVCASWMAEKAMISSKGHLSYLLLHYSRQTTAEPCDDDHQAAEQLQHRIVIQEEVLENLCPPTCLETLIVEGGYIGRQLPNWMRAPASLDFKSLRYLTVENLPCCTQLPDGLCCLPSLESLIITNAPAVKCIGPEFQASSSLAAAGDSASASAPPFPKLRYLRLDGLCEWEEWEWNNDDQEQIGDGGAKDAITAAMPWLKRLKINNCKLSCLPPGIANIKRHTLRELWLHNLTNLAFVDNFPSVVDLQVFDCPKLKRISGLSRLHKIQIFRCSNVEILEGVPALDSLVLVNPTMETFPGYLQTVTPRYLKVVCSKKLHESLLSSPGSSDSEWNKISHIGKHNIGVTED